MLNLTPWYYRELLIDNLLLESPDFYQVEQINGMILFESNVRLKSNLRPKWLKISNFYKDCDGSGTSQYKNVAVYKAISEALERWAFYVSADGDNLKEFCFDENPSTTGMAAYPGFTAKNARDNASLEASERWALHEFWRGNLPIVEHKTKIENLKHFEIIAPFKKIRISLIAYKSDSQFIYSFAADNSLDESLKHAFIELARNQRVMEKFKSQKKTYLDFEDISDKRLFFFSTEVGRDLFEQKIKSAPRAILKNPKLICDTEIKGEWSNYTKVWRYLYADSYPESDTDHTVFMF